MKNLLRGFGPHLAFCTSPEFPTMGQHRVPPGQAVVEAGGLRMQ